MRLTELAKLADSIWDDIYGFETDGNGMPSTVRRRGPFFPLEEDMDTAMCKMMAATHGGYDNNDIRVIMLLSQRLRAREQT